MNPTIQQLILTITTLCLQITAKGDLHADLNIAGYVSSVQVRLLTPGSIGQAMGVVANFDERYDRASYDWLTPEQQHAECVAGLKRIISQLQTHLGAEPQQVAA